MSDEPNESTQRKGREARLRGFARRIFREGDEDDRRLDAREMIGAVLDTGDKARTEIVRLLAREVRGYLEALELHKDLQHILTNYSLDIRTNISLKPLLSDAPAADGDTTVAVRVRRENEPEIAEVDIAEEDIAEE